MNLDHLAVQSYCLRGTTDLGTVLEQVRAIGLSNCELCAVHLDIEDDDAVAKARAACDAAGVSISSFGVNGLDTNEERSRRMMANVKALGARHFSIDFQPQNAAAVVELNGRLAEEYGLTLGIHNHGGRHWLGSSQQLNAIFEIAPPALGLCLDTAWALDAGENPLAMAERFADRLHAIHLKDFIFDRARKPEDVVVGSGNLDLPALLRQLEKQNFDGVAILEYEGDVDNPVPALTHCVEAIRSTLVASF